MNGAETRARILLATVVMKIMMPRLAKYGIAITVDDVLDLFVVAAGAWHIVAPYVERYFPSPAASPRQVFIPSLGLPQQTSPWVDPKKIADPPTQPATPAKAP